MKKQASQHKSIVKKIIRDIYQEKLKPGDKLPPLRELAQQLNADQTSVRIALKHLEFMHVLQIKRSDGVYILDYHLAAGPDFLMELIPESNEIDHPIDSYLIDEIFEYWIVIAPELIRMAWSSYTLKDIREILTLYDKEMAVIDNIPALVQMEIRHIEILTSVAGNLMMTLSMNAIKPVQERIIELFIKGIGLDEFKNYIIMRRDMMRGIFSGDKDSRESNSQIYKQAMERYRQIIRQYIAK